MEDVALGVAWRLAAIVALVFANGFFVAAEFALVTVRKTRVDQLIAEGNRLARAVRRATTDPDSYIAATQLGITMASLGLGWIGEPALARMIEPGFSFLPAEISAATAHTVAVGMAFAVITALHIVLGELAPKTVALQNPEKTALIVAKPTELFMRVFWPFIALLNRMGRTVVTAAGFKPPTGHSLVHSEAELKMLVTASQEAGVLEEAEEQMIHRVFGFGDLTAGQVMIPRTELVTLSSETSLPDTIQIFSGVPHTRLPLYREGTDEVIGLVHVKDLLPFVAQPTEQVRLETVAREALTVPETMDCDDLLAGMQHHGTRDAVVIDEYGSTVGLVTFEQLMERIVGALGPDSGERSPRVVVLTDGSALIDGLALVTDINAQFGLHVDENTYNTVGGYMMGRLGRRARVGDQIDVEGRIMRVEGLDALRVARVFLSRPK